MNKMRVLFLLILSLVIMACGNETQDDHQLDSNKPKNGFDIIPNLSQADSIEIIFYDENKNDTSRYTRYYSFVSIKDNEVLELVRYQLSQAYTQHRNLKECRSTGKFHLHHGEQVIKTIYFSLKDSPCKYLYFIKDGSYYYFELSKELEEVLILTGSRPFDF